MPSGLQCWDTSGNLIFDVNTITSRELGSRFLTSGHYENITVPVAAGKRLYWTALCSGAYQVLTYRLSFVDPNDPRTQGPNEFTIQAGIPPNAPPGVGGTCFIIWGEY